MPRQMQSAGTQPMAPAASPDPALVSLCVRAQVSEPAREMLRSAAVASPGEFVQALAGRGMYGDAVRLIAHSLPKREAVWWAWVCARRAAGEHPSPEIAASLAATERWIAHPDDANRRAAMEAAEQADLGTPAGCAGLAAFFSGGSVAPPEAPATPPDEQISARAVAGGVVLAAVTTEPERAAEKFAAFVQQGVDVAMRVGVWRAAGTPP